MPVVIALVATGIGWSVAWVAATTMIQRLVGDDVMTRVFGINESLQTGAESLGGLAVPILVVAIGPGGALVALGMFLALVAVIAAPVLLSRRIDPAISCTISRSSEPCRCSARCRDRSSSAWHRARSAHGRLPAPR